jgi:hypothetical protein
MISVIVCSKDRVLAESLQTNIEQTIGVAYEMITIDNSVEQHGICAVYNRGGMLARFDILCFVHEDVLFRTQNWGSKLISHFTDPMVGLIGVAGGDSLGSIPSTWSNSLICNEINIIQSSASDPNESIHIHVTAHATTLSKKRVLAIDGVFMCTRKTVFERNRFDEALLRGFHGYDIDYSLQLNLTYRNYAVSDILIEHFSTGSLNAAWLQSTFLIAKKWKRVLPLSVYMPSRGQWKHYHWQSLHVLMQHMFRLQYPAIKIYFCCLQYSCTKSFSVRRFLSMNKLFISSLTINRPLFNIINKVNSQRQALAN